MEKISIFGEWEKVAIVQKDDEGLNEITRVTEKIKDL